MLAFLLYLRYNKIRKRGKDAKKGTSPIGTFGVPNGSSENWQKTIGAHQAFGVGDVTIDAKTGVATMAVTFYMEDMYNFNPGMKDIATLTPDDINGRFSELGWAKEFKTYGSFTQMIRWQLFEPINNSTSNGGGNR